ncbi:hypothetical protein ACE1TH_16220 [Shouchella sp. JSM 1781072]|uniref:hypothetical protein n=1 Tax=Bacillaceae TaxID=186817 RepID=UPI000C06E333|nr:MULTISPECIES: hypothetical protein [Bacillaceae]UTR06148.1 hypothetical protein MM326_19055 [Alkalihalobacillus sp. LMS6]
MKRNTIIGFLISISTWLLFILITGINLTNIVGSSVVALIVFFAVNALTKESIQETRARISETKELEFK